MKSIYFLLTRSDTVVSKLVHFVTADTYTHVSIAFDEDFRIMYSSARKNGRTLFPAGPCREYLHKGYYKRHSKMPCAVYELKVCDETYERAIKEVNRIMAETDLYHYNILGLFLCRFNIPFNRSHHFFCSQFVSEVLHRSHAVELPKETSLMRPINYTELPELHLRYSGYVNKLPDWKKFSVCAE